MHIRTEPFISATLSISLTLFFVFVPMALQGKEQHPWLFQLSYSPETAYRGELKSIYLENASEPELGSVTFLYGDMYRRTWNYAANQVGPDAELRGARMEADGLFQLADSFRLGVGLWHTTIRTPTKPGFGYILASPLFKQTNPDYGNPEILNTLMNLELLDPFLTQHETIFLARGLSLNMDWEFYNSNSLHYYLSGKVGMGKESVSRSLVYKSDLYLGVRYDLSDTFSGFIQAGQTGYALMVEESDQGTYGDGKHTNPGMNTAAISTGVAFSI